MATGVDARLLKSTKFPPEFSQKVDMQKVNLQVMKKWIAGKISDILGNEDDVVIELCFNLIEGPRYPDIKSLQIQLTGFLDKDTASFCKDLWRLLLSAQASPQGVPKELLEAKKLELIQEKIEADRAAESAKKRRDEWDRRDREVADLKDRDRRDRASAQEASGEEVGGLDLRVPASATRGTPTVATVTSLVGGAAAVELDLVDEGPLLDRLQHLAHLDRTRAAVVRRAAPTDLTVGDDPHHPEDRETGERDHDHPEATPTEAEQTVETREGVELLHLALHPRSDVLLLQSEDDTLLQEADR
ncbi:PWI domain-containing protein [Fusarium keratoplasticum]|uniref:PWI domain-containing protein n=1 Tax=Fusarium keratoplasticum TaxID=1328300 RepID=A0ACC0RES6_9HYPO|nr:PWI domain-containing protein [Fusarium keratoplasticum]KAI8684085.1 PWI domain-containing protein [Fusarium keratoplasticum]KAI8688198.1 PWI domain-containing protein [Fusarium keratoplasticum]